MIQHSAVAVAPACLRLLGGWQLIVDGVEVELGHREQRLVALLGLTDLTGRAQVASVLWPESTDEHALGSLRRAVRQCRTKSSGVLVADRLTVALDPGVCVDVDDLRRAAGLTRLPMTDAVARELLDSLRGPELLPGWFDDRVVEERASLEHLRVEALERIAEHGLRQGDYDLAVDASGIASAIEPLRESARELAIRGHLGRGDVAHAAHELQRYGVVMEDELGIEPSDRIRALLEPSVAPPVAPSEQQRVVTVPRQRPSPVIESIPVPPPPMGIDEWLEQGRGHGVRRVLVALGGAAGIAAAVALAMATTGPDPRLPATTDPGDRAALVVPSAGAADPGPLSGPQQARTVRVRLVDSSDGSAAFAVRATPLPAEVRLVVRGPAGLRVVRHVVVRAEDGRQVVVDGLDGGTYQWSATAAAAGQISGEVSVTPPPNEEAVRDDTPSGSTTVAPVVETPSQAPSPAPQPVVTTPSSTPTPSHTPSPTPDPTPSPTPHPSPTSSPTGSPKDPGTVAPTPVG